MLQFLCVEKSYKIKLFFQNKKLELILIHEKILIEFFLKKNIKLKPCGMKKFNGSNSF